MVRTHTDMYAQYFRFFQTKLPDVPFTQTYALCQQKVKVAEHFWSHGRIILFRYGMSPTWEKRTP